MSSTATWVAVLLLEVEELGVAYGRMVAATGIGLRIPVGSLVALIGANGAGKSSVLRAISGLVRAGSGRIAFMGRDITRLPAHRIARLGISHVPEGRGLLPSITVQENLRIGAYGNPNATKADIDQMLGSFPMLRDRLRQPAAFLSGGEQQMLSLARALLKAPKLLLIDEMSLGLAPRLVEQLLETLMRLKAQGLAVLCVEQRTQLVLERADYVYGLKSGKLIIEGTPAALQGQGGVDRLYMAPLDEQLSTN